MDHLSYMQLCRLCLVKDKVNVPIFDDANDVRQIFLKITACLPVKVSRDDNLPKKICNECLYKIDSLYQFWNTTINAEKQLLQWLNEIGVDTTVTNAAAPLQQILPQSHAHPHTEEIILKEEALEDLKPEHNNIIFPSYIPNQQQPPPPNLTKFQPADEEEEDDPPRRRTRGRPAKKKAASVLEAALTAQDSDSVDSDRLADGGADDSDYVDEERVTKEEVDSDEDYVDPLEPTQFVNVSNDAEQPGPSGLNNTAKSTTTLQPPTHTDTGNVSDPLRYFQEDKLEDCFLCGMSFKSVSALREHCSSIHLITAIFPCRYCDLRFETTTQARTHISVDHYAKLKCDICHVQFRTAETLVFHKKSHIDRLPYKCDKCSAAYSTRQSLKLHTGAKHSKKLLICFPCNFTTGYKSYFNLHTEQHDPTSNRIYTCKICQETFTVVNKYSVHVRGHKPKVPHVCDVCGKSVSSKQSLNDHKMIHTGEKPFRCETCGKCFSSRKLRRIHVKSHTNEQNYPCGDCGKKFTQRSTLVIHQRVHTGERPFGCDLCERRFKSSKQMKMHRVTHGAIVV